MIPVYKGEKYLRRTLGSLEVQSFKDFEVLCVDDCSPDDSADIIKEYAKRDPRFRYIRTDENLGIAPKVINFSAPFAAGDYFVYSSQDDLFSIDWLQKMYARALATNADAVLPDVEFFYDGKVVNRRLIGYNGAHEAVVTGRDAFCASLDWTISGNALWRISFLKDFGYFDFGMFADEYSVRYFFLQCETVAFCDAVFFYRQDNPAAITKTPSAKLLDAPYNQYMIWKLIVDSGFGKDVHGPYAVETFRSLIKAQVLISGTPDLKNQHHIITSQFNIIQTQEFSSSFVNEMKKMNNVFYKSSYLLAYQSRRWFDTLSTIAFASERLKFFYHRFLRKRPIRG